MRSKGGVKDGKYFTTAPPQEGKIFYRLAGHQKVYQTIFLHSGRYKKWPMITIRCYRDEIYVKAR
jgi:hypothetical protein